METQTMNAADTIDSREVLTARAVTVPLDPADPDPRVILSAVDIIRHGGVIAHPTETVYGLAADPFNAAAVERLTLLKGRVAPQALILLLGHAEAAHDLARMPGVVREWFGILARAFWPGPLTLVLPARPRLACPALAGGDTVAVRVSSHAVALLLVRTLGSAITSTSANRSASAPAATADALEPGLASQLDLVLDAGRAPGGLPSTILDLSRSVPTLLRSGAVTPDRIARVLGFAPRTGSLTGGA